MRVHWAQRNVRHRPASQLGGKTDVAYLSHSGNTFSTPRRRTGALNWRLIFVLAANTLGWLLIGALIIQAL